MNSCLSPGGSAAVATPEPLTVREAAPRSRPGRRPRRLRARAETEARAGAGDRRPVAARPLVCSRTSGFSRRTTRWTRSRSALKQERFSAAGFFASDPNHPPLRSRLERRPDGLLDGGPLRRGRAARRARRRGPRSPAARLAGRTRDAAAFRGGPRVRRGAARRGRARAAGGARSGRAPGPGRSPRALQEQGMTTAADPARARAAVARGPTRNRRGSGRRWRGAGGARGVDRARGRRAGRWRSCPAPRGR